MSKPNNYPQRYVSPGPDFTERGKLRDRKAKA